MLTPAVTITFSKNATKPTLMSFISIGKKGNRLLNVLWLSVIAATVATPTTMPQKTPVLVAGLLRIKLQTSPGNNCVTKE